MRLLFTCKHVILHAGPVMNVAVNDVDIEWRGWSISRYTLPGVSGVTQEYIVYRSFYNQVYVLKHLHLFMWYFVYLWVAAFADCDDWIMGFIPDCFRSHVRRFYLGGHKGTVHGK